MSFFYDPFVYRSTILNYQFNKMILPSTLIPFSLVFVSLSVHFGLLFLKTSGYSTKLKYFIFFTGSFFQIVYITIILVANIKIAMWRLEQKELNDTLRVVIASIYCFDVVMFILRTIFFVRKITKLSQNNSLDSSKKKLDYIFLCFWLILISFGYLVTFVFLMMLTFDKIKHDLKKNIISHCFFYFGIAICCFGLNFLFKPKTKKSFSTKSI